MSTRATIHDAICDIVDSISSSVIAVKYRYPEGKPTSFPATMTLFAGDEEEMVDTVTNMVRYRFSIVTVYPIDESATGYQKWLDLYDTLTAELRKKTHQTLEGNAINFMVETSGRPSFTDQYGQQVVVLDIRVVAEVLQSIVT